MSYRDYFKGKKITVMGIDPEGRGVQDVAFLAKYGALVTATDLKTKDELSDSLSGLEKYKNIRYVLGEHKIEDFVSVDLIIRAASTPPGSRYLKLAIENKIDIETDETLFLKLAPKIIFIGVTGTRGKSTVTHLIHHILSSVGKKVHLAGNVRGVATLPLLDVVSEGDFIVFELDSWKLQQFGENKLSPHIAVFTTFLPDHMNYYKDMQQYFDDKANIFKFQTENDTLIITKQAKTAIEKYYHGDIKSNQVVVSPMETGNKILLGDHNKENAACAAEAVRRLGVSDYDINKAIASFGGIEGRLQFVREVNGVKIYNDNNATTPDATIVALRALGSPSTPSTGSGQESSGKNKNIVLILGGSDKGLDMSELISEIPRHCKAVILFKEKGTDKIAKDVKNLSNVLVHEEDGIGACVKKAMSVARSGDTLLYSPAFASFGKYFKNEHDRGYQFMKIVESL